MTTVAALCSGYGGLELGVGLVEDVDLIWHAEVDPAAIAVHDVHWPDSPNVGDIREAGWSWLVPPELLTAGYPCQPFSHAGRRKGAADANHLWPHVAEAVRVLRPRRVLLENVAGHLALGFGDVLGDLATLGYRVRWGCVRASDAGACHRRTRVFIAAAATNPGGGRAARDARAVPDPPRGPRRPHLHVHPADDDRGAAADPRGVGLPPGTGLRESGPGGLGRRRPDHDGDPVAAWGRYEPAIRRWEHLTRPAPPPVDDRRRLSPRFVEWMMGLEDGWVTGRGLGRTVELRLLGNGVVPQAAAIAWRCLR